MLFIMGMTLIPLCETHGPPLLMIKSWCLFHYITFIMNYFIHQLLQNYSHIMIMIWTFCTIQNRVYSKQPCLWQNMKIKLKQRAVSSCDICECTANSYIIMRNDTLSSTHKNAVCTGNYKTKRYSMHQHYVLQVFPYSESNPSALVVVISLYKNVI